MSRSLRGLMAFCVWAQGCEPGSAPEGRPTCWLGLFEPRVDYLGRMRGLLFEGPDGVPLALAPCKSVHTFGMRFPLDVAFVGMGGAVLYAERGVGPGRVISQEGSCLVLERPASDDFWPQAGMTVGYDIPGEDEWE